MPRACLGKCAKLASVIRTHRRIFAWLALAAFAFAQLAVSAYACPAMAGAMAQELGTDSAETCPEPANLPPTGSPVLLRCMELVAHPVNETVVEGQTYDYYIKSNRTDSTKRVFAPYDEESIKSDFWSLWRTGFLDNLWIEVIDEPYANGVEGKHVIFHIEERARVKAVDYLPALGTKTQVETSKIEDQLKEKNVRVNLDSFVDEATIRRVKGIIREVYAEKGYQDVTIEHKLAEMPAGPKLVHLTFIINQGPKYKIKAVAFDGNTAFSDSALRSQLKENKPKNWYSFLTSSGTYLEAKFADDADKVQVFYLNKGYVRARVGQPQIETVSTSKDGKTRWIRLRIPVDEGVRYNIGKFDIADNTALRSEFLRAQFKIKEGDVYNYTKISKGLEKARDAYGTLGSGRRRPTSTSPRGIDMSTGLPTGPGEPPPIVDVTVRMIEGKQFFVNKITFLGNTTTHDNVARREMRVLEGGVFNTDALKQSIRRLNQLGYFKPLEGKEDEMSVVPTPGKEGLVDIRLKFQEQNRNQITFGAGVSQFDGFFGQLSFQTSNFLGRGETFAVNR